MKKILVISWFYPPENSSEGLVTFKLINNSRFEYDVFTQSKNENWSYGMNMLFPNRENVHVFFGESRTLDKWKEEAFRFFEDHKKEYDCVMTRSMPPESHEVGLQIKKAYPDTRWIASFGDPIKNFPYQHIDGSLYSVYSMHNLINRDKGFRYMISPKRVLKDLWWNHKHEDMVKYRKRLSTIEENTLAQADKVIFNNLSQQRHMVKTEEIQKKAVIIRHSFDKQLYQDLTEQDQSQKKKIRFVFIGELNYMRSALPLLEAIKKLNDVTKDVAEKAEFLFYGKMPDRDLAFIMKNHLQDCIKYKDPISYAESLRVAVQADWLMHFDADIGKATDENIFFAGKIADYFGAGAPIIAVTMSSGDVADELRKAGMLVLSFSASEIQEYLYLIRYKGYHLKPERDYIQNYSAEQVAKVFDHMVVEQLVLR